MIDNWKNSETVLVTELQKDAITDEVCKHFTYKYNNVHEFVLHTLPELPIYNIGLITGNSGSGKSLLLKELGKSVTLEYDKAKAVCSHFKDFNDAQERLLGAGFNSIPEWLVPWHILSTGQKYRVDLARSIGTGTVFDEFTSVIDRNTALGLCNSIQKYIRDKDFRNVVFASVHCDIIPYLNPDWVYDTNTREITFNKDKYDIKNNKLSKLTKQFFMKI